MRFGPPKKALQFAGVALLAALAYACVAGYVGTAGWGLNLTHTEAAAASLWRGVVWPLLADGLVSAFLISLIGIFLLNLHGFGMPVAIQFFLFVAGWLGFEYASLYLIFPSLAQQLCSFQPAISLGIRLFLASLYGCIFMLWKARFNQEEAPALTAPIAPIPTPPAVEPIDRITVRTGNGIKVIGITQLLYIKSEGDYIALVTAEGRWLKEQTMKSIQESLPSRQFVRIHRSFLVNVEAISRIERYGEQQLVALRNGDSIRISASGYKALREALGI